MKIIYSQLKGIIKTSIGKNVFSTFLGVGINIFAQVVLVPFYIGCWGNELYSDWIVLSAITAFFSVTDIGLTTITVNSFSISYAEDKHDECNALLANSTMLLFGVFSICLLSLIVIFSVGNIVSIAGLHVLQRREASIILFLFVIKIFLGMLGAVYNAIYRAASQANRGIMAVNVSKTLECFFIILCLLLKAPIIVTALFYILPTVLLYYFLKIDATRRIYHYKFSFRYLNFPLFKSLIVPSLSFMALPFSQTLNTQGMTVIVNSFFGPEIVVLFNTTRTLANFAKSLIFNFQNAVWPEFTVAYAHNNSERIRKIARMTFKVSILLAIVMGAGLMICGDWIYEIWTRGKIVFSLNLMRILMLLLLTDTVWSTARMTLNATNNHIKMTPYLLLSTIIALVFSYLLGYIGQNVVYVIGCLIIIDMIMAPITIKQSLKLTKDNLLSWLFK